MKDNFEKPIIIIELSIAKSLLDKFQRSVSWSLTAFAENHTDMVSRRLSEVINNTALSDLKETIFNHKKRNIYRICKIIVSELIP